MKKLLYLLLIFLCAGAPAKEDKVMESRIAGSWYTADKQKLRKQIAGYIASAGKKKCKNVIGLIMPHAGYRYSGSIAGFAVREIVGRKYSRVIIIGPSHYAALFNKISIPDIDAYQTPLGKIALDTDFIKKLKKSAIFVSRTGYHQREHSIQIELPFIQYAIPGTKAVPLMVGQLDLQTTRKIANILLELIDKNTLVIVSSDFTHYGKRFGYAPFGNNFQTESKIRKLDLKAFDFVRKKDLSGFVEFIRKTGATVCGKHALGILTGMLPENSRVLLLKQGTSSGITGFKGSSVSYIAAAVSGRWEAPKARKLISMDIISHDSRRKLLQLARKTIEFYLDEKRAPEFKELKIKATADMNKTLGAFVTLHKNGALRGCIGNYPRKNVPLYQVVSKMALASAFKDYRFKPLKKDELKDIDIEISVLNQPKAVKSWKDIIIDRDGIILRKVWAAAVFLPQVAPEQKWTLEETLSYLSRKAGLSKNAWRKNAKFEVFQADVFGEKQRR